MCGVVGIFSNSAVNQQLYDALIALQHRGQDAAGMLTCDGLRLNLHKSNGLVHDVFRKRHMYELKGNMGIAHIRYPTAGSNSLAEAQPFYVNSPFGIALAHNGNLVNSRELEQEIFKTDKRHINTSSDSEILLNILAHELHKTNNYHLSHNDIFSAIDSLYNRCKGGYAVVALIVGHGIIGFRDPFGIRPLVYGSKQTKSGTEYMIASESVALDMQGFNLIGDVKPGELVYINNSGQLYKYQSKLAKPSSPCIFEYVYLSRPDSIIENISVYKARLNMGKKLAKKILKLYPDHDIDVVMPVPDTSRTAAITLAYHLGVKHREGLIKNHYIGRTFIMPGQKQRKKSVRQKLNAVADEFKNKTVLLVDDSIVRGTTSREIIQMARDAGAKKVYFASAAPPVRFPNVYGIDMPTQEELVAYQRSEQEITEYLGADLVIYQDIVDLKKSINAKHPELTSFETSIFDGQYITGNVDSEYFSYLYGSRGGHMDSSNTEQQNINSQDYSADCIMAGVETHNLL